MYTVLQLVRVTNEIQVWSSNLQRIFFSLDYIVLHNIFSYEINLAFLGVAILPTFFSKTEIRFYA